MSSHERRVTSVGTASPEGQRLLAQVAAVITGRGWRFDPVVNPTQVQVAQRSVREDIVILDATVEPGGGSSYPAFTAQPMIFAHILVVSRTPLPLNFYGLREGGAPPFPQMFGNDEILRWLDTQLTDLGSAKQRPWWARNMIGATISAIPSYTSLKATGPQAFVSYRREALPAARELAARLTAGDADITRGGPIPVTLLEPGELAYEDELLSLHGSAGTWRRCSRTGCDVAPNCGSVPRRTTTAPGGRAWS